MEPQLDFKELFQRFTEPPTPTVDPKPCTIASDFAKKLEAVIFQPLGQHPSRGQLAQARYILQELYFAHRKLLPPGHSSPTSQGRVHTCLESSYHAAFERLELIELTLRPPALIANYDELVRRVPEPDPPSPAPVVHQIAGIFLGLDDDDV